RRQLSPRSPPRPAREERRRSSRTLSRTPLRRATTANNKSPESSCKPSRFRRPARLIARQRDPRRHRSPPAFQFPADRERLRPNRLQPSRVASLPASLDVAASLSTADRRQEHRHPATPPPRRPSRQ